MMRPAPAGAAILFLLIAAACTPTWNHDSGARTLSASGVYLAASPGAPPAAGAMPAEDGRTVLSLPVAFMVPVGWHWFERGDDLIATKDGVFLQHFFIERIHIKQTEQAVAGAFPLAAFSSKQWPILTVKNLKQRFAAGMPPAEAAEVLLASRAHDPAVTDLQVQKVVTRTVAGRQAFRATFEFRLKGAAVDPSPLYRSVYCGFMEGDWFYGVSYTAAARYYFDRDAATFETFLESFRVVDR
jgi:hypothetical protein